MNILKILFVCIILATGKSSNAQLNKEAVNAFIKRIVSDKASHFAIEYASREKGKDVFELESLDQKIVLRGSASAEPIKKVSAG